MNILSKAIIFSILIPSIAWAQGASFSLGGSAHDNSLPVEVTADNLSVDQASSSAKFSGNARVGQGDLRLGADEITVNYNQDTSEIASVTAQGSVVFTNGVDSAESANAKFDVEAGVLVMNGNVLLLQGKNAFTGDSLSLDIIKSTANLSGNVKTVLAPN